MRIPPLTDLAGPLAEHLLNGLILSAGIFLGAVILLPLCFRADRWSAATRYQVSLITFMLLASTPLLVVLKPVLPTKPSASLQAVTNYTGVKNVPESPLIGRLIHEPTDVERSAQPITLRDWLSKVEWPPFLVVGWAALSLVCVLRLLFALYRLRVLHRSARPIVLTEPLYCSRPITIAESPLVSSPVAVGLWSAKVLLPLGFQARFSATEQRNVLLHEIAHLERSDDWFTFLQQLLLALFPINPFLWATSRILQLHQEAACDDRVLLETHQAKSYAHLLARLADGNIERSMLAAGVSRQGKQLYQRLTRILDSTRDRDAHPSLRKVIAAGISLLGASVAGLVWLPAVAWTPSVRASEPQIVAGPRGPEVTRPSLDPEIISLLTSSALGDPDPRVRQEATFALSDHDGNDVTTALLTLFNQSEDEQVRLAIVQRMTPKRAADPTVKEKLNDLALHEPSILIRTAAIELLARHLDTSTIDQLITIYRTANGLPIRAACLRGLGGTDSKVAKGFLISVAKEDPDPQLRCVALRSIANEPTVVQEFVVNGQHVQLAQDAMLQRMETYRKSLDTMNRLNGESGTITLGQGPLPLPDGGGPKENRFFVAPGPEERFELRDQPPVFPKQFPEEPKVDPSPKPSPSVSE
jgi:beta-lactamase regulating signal transducer with metallopeptidase domain